MLVLINFVRKNQFQFKNKNGKIEKNAMLEVVKIAEALPASSVVAFLLSTLKVDEGFPLPLSTSESNESESTMSLVPVEPTVSP